jgi:HEAT repeat protein
MTGRDQPPTPDRLLAHLEAERHGEAVAWLDRIETVDAEARKRSLREIRGIAERHPALFDVVADRCAEFLTDGDRAVRLTTAKLFVTLARSEPAIVRSAVDALADRLADADEFYYVRARCAETLGYVALDAPELVGDPETLADLRVGLSFDAPEVREKLAEALAHVALGDPSRLRHQVATLSDQLDDERDLVRYHLCTALVVVGCVHPERLSDAADPLRDRLTDGNPYVRGRALEALALLVGSGATVGPVLEDLTAPDGDDDERPQFLTDRLEFLRRQVDTRGAATAPEGVGTVESVREGTAEAVAAIRSSDGDSCPHCGIDLPDGGPPICPRCGTPR